MGGLRPSGVGLIAWRRWASRMNRPGSTASSMRPAAPPWPLDQRIVARVHEERDRVALAAGAIDDAMQGRGEDAVGPDFEHLADIDHEGALDRRHRHPFSVAVLDLEPAIAVLHQDGEG